MIRRYIFGFFAIFTVIAALLAGVLHFTARATSIVHVETSYINTGDVSTNSGDDKVLIVEIPQQSPYLTGWTIGQDVNAGDVIGMRVNCLIGTTTSTDPFPRTAFAVGDTPIGDYLWRPGRQMRGAPLILPAPYILDSNEKLFLAIRYTNDSQVSSIARCNIVAYFLVGL